MVEMWRKAGIIVIAILLLGLALYAIENVNGEIAPTPYTHKVHINIMTEGNEEISFVNVSNSVIIDGKKYVSSYYSNGSAKVIEIQKYNNSSDYDIISHWIHSNDSWPLKEAHHFEFYTEATTLGNNGENKSIIIKSNIDNHQVVCERSLTFAAKTNESIYLNITLHTPKYGVLISGKEVDIFGSNETDITANRNLTMWAEKHKDSISISFNSTSNSSATVTISKEALMNIASELNCNISDLHIQHTTGIKRTVMNTNGSMTIYISHFSNQTVTFSNKTESGIANWLLSDKYGAPVWAWLFILFLVIVIVIGHRRR